jgi:hypothetical protein
MCTGLTGAYLLVAMLSLNMGRGGVRYMILGNENHIPMF